MLRPPTQMPAKPKVAVHGSYYANNFGDTLIVKIMCDWASDVVGRENVYLAMPGRREEQEAVGYPVISPARRGCISHLIFSGGGYFGEPSLPPLKRLKWYRRNYQRHLAWVGQFPKAEKAAFGLGIGPLSSVLFRRAVRSLFRQFSFYYVRDTVSLDYAHKYGFNAGCARLGIDLAMSVVPASGAPERAIAIHATSMPHERLRELIAYFPRQGANQPSIDIVLDLPISARERQRLQALIAEAPAPVRLVEYDGVSQLLERLGRYELVITSKLHVGIVATALGRSVVSVPVHQKTKRFYSDLGLSRYCLDDGEQSLGAIAALALDSSRYTIDRALVDEQVGQMRQAVATFLEQRTPRPLPGPRSPLFERD